MWEILLWIVGLGAAVCAVVAGVIYLSVQGMSNPDLTLTPIDREGFADPFEVFDGYRDWAQQQGLDWIGAYMLEGTANIFVGAWRHPTQPLYFCVYQAQGRVFHDFVTIFDPEHGVTTGSTSDALLLPKAPGAYTQAFTGLSLDEQYHRHLEAEVLLTNKFRWRAQPIDEPFDRVVVRAIHRHMAYVKSLPLWPVRGVWWYFVTRRRLLNRSVADQLANSPG